MEARFERLSLLSDEEEEIVLDSGKDGVPPKKYELCLVGSIVTDRNINLIAMKHRLASLWRPRKGINIQSIDHELYIF